MSLTLVIHRLLLFKRPQKTIFNSDFLEYQTEKEMRMIEFEDDMDELEAEKLENRSLVLPEISKHFRSGEGELV